jgi:hypothetical protein
MTSQSFEQGFSVLLKVFPNMNFDAKLFWDMLSDLDGQYFLMSVWEFVKKTKDIYPGTNIIATIRGKAIDLQNEALQNSTLKLEAETEKERIDRWQREASPMPDDCKKALEKLGITLTTGARE